MKKILNWIKTHKILVAIITVASLVNEYLASTNSVVLPQPLGTIVLQNVLQWLRSEHLDIRYTVEGNSGDSCRQRQYSVGYYEILGYGIPAY